MNLNIMLGKDFNLDKATIYIYIVKSTCEDKTVKNEVSHRWW